MRLNGQQAAIYHELCASVHTHSASEGHPHWGRWGGGRETEQNEYAKGSHETEKQQTLHCTARGMWPPSVVEAVQRRGEGGGKNERKRTGKPSVICTRQRTAHSAGQSERVVSVGYNRPQDTPRVAGGGQPGGEQRSMVVTTH